MLAIIQFRVTLCAFILLYTNVAFVLMQIRVIYNYIVAGSAGVEPPPALSLGAHAGPVGGEYRVEYITGLFWLPAPCPLLLLLVLPCLTWLSLSYHLWIVVVLPLVDALLPAGHRCPLLFGSLVFVCHLNALSLPAHTIELRDFFDRNYY